MIPNFDVFGKTISAYMIAAVIGIMASLLFTYCASIKKGIDEINTLYIVLISFVGVFLGAHLLYGLTNFKLLKSMIEYIPKFSSFLQFVSAIKIVFGGAVFYGGLIGALIFAFIYMKVKNLNLGDYSDVCAPAIPLFHFFGRIGCFLSGCCYGVEWEHGITYHHSLAESANGVARFPVQLAEAAFNLCLFVVLYVLLKHDKLKHKLLAIYLIAYSVARFVLEFFRGDEYRGFVGVFSTSQFVAVLLIIITTAVLIIQGIKKRMS